MSDEKKIDEVTGVSTTGHEWDGVTELNNPMPRWWLYVFYATIAFAVVYMVIYPSVPLGTTYYKGTAGYSQRVDVAEDLAASRADKSAFLDRIAATEVTEITGQTDLLNFSLQGGRVAFLDNCAGCHGSGALGAEGYPNLADDDWLWGGDIAAVYETIQHGVRWDADDDTRYSEMPNFGADELLGNDEIASVTEYVLKISGADHDAAQAAAGTEIYAEQCAACHMDDGSGDIDQGAPALNDAIWLHGEGRAFILSQLNRARHGQMPAWAGRLDDTTIKMLSVYVNTLGGN